MASWSGHSSAESAENNRISSGSASSVARHSARPTQSMSLASTLEEEVREVPFHRAAVGDEEIAAVSEVIRSGWLTMGPKTIDFEKRFAAYVGARHATAVCSGTPLSAKYQSSKRRVSSLTANPPGTSISCVWASSNSAWATVAPPRAFTIVLDSVLRFS